MFYLKLIFSVSLFCSAVFAVEGKEEAAATNETYSGKQDQNWETVQTNLAAVKAKLDTQASVVQTLILEKNSLKGEALSEKIGEIKKEHQKYEQMVFDYNKLNDEFLTKYPERGLKEKRIYKRAKMKSLDSFEDDVTLRGKVNRLHRKILNQYPKAFDSKNKNQNSAGVVSGTQKTDDNVTEPILYKK